MSAENGVKEYDHGLSADILSLLTGRWRMYREVVKLSTEEQDGNREENLALYYAEIGREAQKVSVDEFVEENSGKKKKGKH